MVHDSRPEHHPDFMKTRVSGFKTIRESAFDLRLGHFLAETVPFQSSISAVRNDVRRNTWVRVWTNVHEIFFQTVYS